MATESLPTLFTVKQVAAATGFSESTIRKYALEGELPAVRIGGSWRFRLEDIEARLNGGAS